MTLMERLIAWIDDILKGENKMDFAVFSKTEMEEMFQTMVEHMPEDMRNIAIREFKSVEQWKEHYVEVISSEKTQKGYAKPSPRRLQKATTNGLKQFCKNEYRQQWKRIMQFTQQTNPAESPAQNVPQDGSYTQYDRHGCQHITKSHRPQHF